MSLREDHAAGDWTPPCAWCGAASDRQIVVSAGMAHTRDSGTFRIEMPREVPACSQCGPDLVRLSPGLRRAKIRVWANVHLRRQQRLL